MKKVLRQFTGFIIMGPFILSIKFLSLFSSREKAIAAISPLIIKVAKIFVRILVPHVNTADDFNKLRDTIIKRAPRLRLLFDITFAEKNDDMLKLRIANCPFAEIAERLGYAALGPVICQGDWEVARDNIDKWDFEREHQIGTGDCFCDHTYIRKERNNK